MDDVEFPAECPKCCAVQNDLDGFGVLFCEACGYCSCPSIIDDECQLCGRVTITDALTLQQPWPFAVMYLGKDVENRTWKAPARIIGKRIAIHAGKTFAMGASFPGGTDSWIPEVTRIKDALARSHHGVSYPAMPMGAIVCTAVVKSCERESTSRWWVHGNYAWALADVVVAKTPIFCSGAQGVWSLKRANIQLRHGLKKGPSDASITG